MEADYVGASQRLEHGVHTIVILKQRGGYSEIGTELDGVLQGGVEGLEVIAEIEQPRYGGADSLDLEIDGSQARKSME
jgi:hypothetical protein